MLHGSTALLSWNRIGEARTEMGAGSKGAARVALALAMILGAHAQTTYVFALCTRARTPRAAPGPRGVDSGSSGSRARRAPRRRAGTPRLAT